MKYPVALMPTEEGYAIREYLEVANQLAGQQNLREVEIPA